MTTLQFTGKNISWNHHLAVPYHTLEEEKKVNEKKFFVRAFVRFSKKGDRYIICGH